MEARSETSIDFRHWARLSRSVLNGVVGDHLARQGSPLAIEMGFQPAAGVPDPSTAYTGRVAVLVHGLTNRETIFRFRDPDAGDYGLRLQRDLGFTPLFLRYNTGLPLEENGRRFAALLEELVEEYPVPLDELVLIGFSMGGLVARIAQREAQQRDLRWGHRLTDCVYLGTPHEGARLERLGRFAGGLLRRLPGDAGARWADRADLRSAGIRDLGDGLKDADPRTYHPGARHHFVSGSLTRRSGGLVDRVLGDGLVTRDSACPEAAPSGSTATHFAGVSHFPLAYSDAVYRRIATALGEGPQGTVEDAARTEELPRRSEEDSPRRLLAGTLHLAGEAVEGVSDAVRDAHLSIAGVPHRWLEPIPGVRRISGVVEGAHRAVAGLVYGLVRGSGTLARAASSLVDEG